MLCRIKNAGLTIKKSKCQFAMKECVYLGHKIGSGTVTPDTAKVQGIRKFTVSKTKKQVRPFLGLAGYYRKCIPQHSTLAAPLPDFTHKSEPNVVNWTPACEIAFQKLKIALSSSPDLRSPDFTGTFVLQTDASHRGVEAVLSQTGESGHTSVKESGHTSVKKKASPGGELQ